MGRHKTVAGRPGVNLRVVLSHGQRISAFHPVYYRVKLSLQIWKRAGHALYVRLFRLTVSQHFLFISHTREPLNAKFLLATVHILVVFAQRCEPKCDLAGERVSFCAFAVAPESIRVH